VSISGPDNVEAGTTAYWSADVSGGTPPYRYTWETATMVGNDAVFSQQCDHSDTIYLTVTDANNHTVNVTKHYMTY
jgi:hypothetical protein